MGIFRSIIGRKSSSNPDSRSVRSPVFERLEPRIMLSGDGLLSCFNTPDTLQDNLLDNTLLVEQSADLLDSDTLAQEQVIQEQTSYDTLDSDIYKPILTLSQEGDTNSDSDDEDMSVGIVNSTEINSEPDLQLAGSDDGIALVVGEDLFEDNGVQPIGEDVDTDCLESCQRQLIIEQLTETLRVPHGPPGTEGVLASLDDVQLEYLLSGEPNAPANDSIVIAEDEILSGSGVYDGDLINYGTISPGNSPGIIIINGNLTIVGTDTDTIDDSYIPPAGDDTVGTIQIEIADNGEDPIGPVPGTDFDQIIVNGDVLLGGTLEIVLLDDFIPEEGDTFDIIIFTGDLLDGADSDSEPDKLDNATGLFGFGDGSLFFDVEVLSDRVRLVVKEAPGAGNIISSTPAINDVLGQFYSDYFTIDPAITVAGELTIDDFVTLSGSFSFGVTTTEVTVKTGLPADVTEPFDDFGSTITNVGMLTLTIGAADVHAFVGLNGPYWVDDLNGDGIIDDNETNPDAIGLSVTYLDIGFVLMKPFPLNPLNPEDAALQLLALHPSALFYSLKATADDFEFVGWDEIILSAEQIEINLNSGVPWPLGLGTPVVDFATSFPDTDGDGPDQVGFEVETGGDPVCIDFGGKKIGFSSERITVQLSQFVYITGSFAFEKGPATSVHIATGLPSSLLGLLEEVLNDVTGTDLGTQIRDFATVIPDVQVSTFQIGASDVHAFVGLNGPYWVDDLDGDGKIDKADEDLNENGSLDEGEDLDGDGNLDVDETNPEAVGLVVNELDIGFVTMAPTIGSFAQSFIGISEEDLKGIIPKFTALKATADSVEFVGFEEVQFSLKGITINYNNGTEWYDGLGPPVVDFLSSFPAEETDVDVDDDGKTGEPAGFEVNTGGDPVYIDFDGNQRIGAIVEKVTLQISEFIHVTGSVAFEMGPVQEVGLTGGLLSELGGEVVDLLVEFGFPESLADLFPSATGAETTEVSFMTIGASDVHAFVGLDGPYWIEDLDGDGEISWAFDTTDFASLYIDALGNSPISIGGMEYSVGDELPYDTVITLSSSDGWIEVNGVKYGDIDGDGVVDANETAELSEEAVGIVINDFDFGMAIMTPTNPLDFARYFALRATAMEVALVGIEDFTLEATHLLVEVNLSSPSVYGLPLFPVIDFAGTEQFASEQLALFDENGDGVITLGDLATLNDYYSAGFASLEDVELDDPTPVDHEKLLETLNTNDTEDSHGVIDLFEAAALFGWNETTMDEAAMDEAIAADEDGDGKIDQLGYEVETGGDPVYLTMDSSLIRAQGFIELDIFGVVTLVGNFAFELGPTITNPTLTDGSVLEETLTTLTIGASNVFGFIGWDGPYFVDGNENQQIDVDEDGNPLPGEVNPDAVGLALSDLNIGILIAVSPISVDAFVAVDFEIDEIAIVGLDFLTAEATLALELNIGGGLSSSLAAINFLETFPDEGGFEVNTGDPAAPVLLDFDEVVVSIELAGELTIADIVSMLGIFYLETDGQSFKLFADVNLEIGPDIGRGEDSLLDIEALAVVSINDDGFAADLTINLDVGIDALGLSVAARVLINTTGNNQEVIVPDRLIDFLEASTSPLAVDVLNRLDSNNSYLISGRSPIFIREDGTLDLEGARALLGLSSGEVMYTTEPGAYAVVVLHGEFDFVGFVTAEGTGAIALRSGAFEMLVDIDFLLGPLKFSATGALGLFDDGITVYLDTSLDAEISGVFHLDVDGTLDINTRGSNNYFRLAFDGNLNLLYVINLSAWGNIEVNDGKWTAEFSISGNFLSLFSVSGSASLNSDGEFNLVVDGRVQIGPDGFNISGDAHLEVSYLYDSIISDKILNVEGWVSGSVEIFWIEFEIVDLGVSYNSATGDIKLSVGPVPVPAIGWACFWGICIPYPTIKWKYYTFTIGTLKVVAQPPPEIHLGYVNDDDILVLYVGPDAAERNLMVDEEDEGVLIEHLSGNSVVGEDIRITMFGHSEDFEDVFGIYIEDMAAGDDSVEIYSGVTIPITINHFGEGMDRLSNLGSGVVIAYGDEDNDRLEGGSANDQLYGETGADFIDGKAGDDWIEGGDGADVLIGGAGSDTIIGGDGVDLIAGDLTLFPPVLYPPDLVADSQDVDSGGWNLNANDEITNATDLPHISIQGTGDGTFDYYSFTVTGSNQRGIFDIDAENFNTQLFLYDSNGNLLWDNDDNGSDPGDGTSGASLIDYVFPTAGTYIIGVGTYASFNVVGQGDVGQIGGKAPDEGDYYTLHISLEGHAINPEGTDPVSELEPNQPLPPVPPDSFVLQTMASETGGEDTLEGGDGDDIILGSSGNDVINGGVGEDLLIGDDGIVTLSSSSEELVINYELTDLGFSGNDIIDGGADNDTLFGQNGEDTLLGGEGDDGLYGNEGSDTIYGGSGLDEIYGGTEADTIYGDEDRDLIYGNDGNDELHGGTGDDDIYGGTGSDSIYGDSGNDLIYGNEDDDEIHGGSGEDHIYGGTGDDTIYGDGDNDVIEGNDGNDIIIGNEGIDTIYGGEGNDILIGDNGVLDFAYNGDTDLTTLDLIRSATDGLGGDDYIYGNAGDDVLVGGTGGDRIDGNEGKDLILGDNGVLTYMNDDTSNPRFRVLEGTVMYGETDGVDDGQLLIDRDYQFNDPAGIPQWAIWEVTLSLNWGGADYIAGGPDNDQIFGQGGNDIIQGDGSIGTIDTPTAVNAYRNAEGLLVVSSSVEDTSDGDDYIEGNDGDDIIFGNLGQDDIIGGSSGLFGLDTAANRTDGTDMLFGGAGTELMRNETGNILDEGDASHSRDSDMILGDNGNIYRLVGTNGTDGDSFLAFNYDNYGTEKIIVRGTELLDYTPGGMDYDEINAVNDNGAPDEIHGESGDDFLYGMKGNDVIFGEGQDDDIIGGYGHDWISGGTGDDGVLGDDGRIYTSRNRTAEPLYGIDDLAGELDKHIRTPDKKQQATINVTDKLKKTVNLTPFKLDDFDPLNADDIIFGGWGNDFLHGGDGDDAISGAEALTEYYSNPVNPGDVLKFREGEFGAYNRDDPLAKVYWNSETGEFGGTEEFLLNFDHTEGDPVNDVNTDGDDVIFGDLGNDWLVGGTGRDHIYGGRGSDLLNADDNLETAGGTNNEPDGSETSYEDIAYGGAGPDVLIANISSDRLIDWVGDFNLYALPYTSFGAETISRNLKPKLFEFLYDLSKSDGADQTLGDSNDPRNGEPNGELGLVMQKDPDWEDQQTPD